MNNIIECHQAKEFPEERRQDQQKYIDEFLESDCELMNGRDLQYYVDNTGKSLEWIVDNGRNINPVVKEAIHATGSLDDVWDYDPFTHYEPEDEIEDEEEIDFWINQWKRDGFKVPKKQLKSEL
jgi:hypothetical protein